MSTAPPPRQPAAADDASAMDPFPRFTNDMTFDAWRADPSRWLPRAIDIARHHSLPHADLHVFPTGTNLVVALGSALILKIFPPTLRHQFVSERTSLSQLRNRLDVAVPEIVLEGERDQWPYLVMMRLDGILGTEAWPLLPEDQKEIVLGQIGETIAQVQRVPVGELARLEPRWKEFILRQIDGCRARHLRLGLPQRYLDGLDDLFGAAPALIPMDASPVILTGEYTPENFLLAQGSGGWRLSGLIDFGDVMTGWGEYDLLGPSAFMTAGMPGRVRNLFRGFGYSQADMSPTLTRRLMTLLFLHRFSDPARQIGIEGWQQKTDSLGDLERLLWPV
ncbi:hygromycin-B 7''-O-kinase [Rhizobiales bacterium GAS191]|nr:hygromycin-B 7''-O-kinase [Rhizobiales bacterium GAS191]